MNKWIYFLYIFCLPSLPPPPLRLGGDHHPATFWASAEIMVGRRSSGKQHGFKIVELAARDHPQIDDFFREAVQIETVDIVPEFPSFPIAPPPPDSGTRIG